MTMQDCRGQFEEAVRTYGVRGLALRIGVTPAYVSMIASGRRELTPKVLTRLEEAVNKTNERVMRFELTTLCLGSTYSTTELHPQVRFNYRQQDKSLSTSSRGDPTGRP